LERAALDDHRLAWAQRLHPFEHRARRLRRPERENFRQAHRIERARNLGQREQRLDLGAEVQTAAMLYVEEGPDTGAIPRQEHATTRAIPQCDGELTIQV